MTPQDNYDYEPSEYKIKADKFAELVNITNGADAFDSFTLQATMDYFVGKTMESTFIAIRKIAEEMIERGHTTPETEVDFYSGDQYAYAFKKDTNLFYVKRDQQTNVVVIFDDKYNFKHIRSYYDSELDEYYVADIKEYVDKIKASEEIDYASINSLAGLVGMMSDSKISEYPNRLSLEDVINGKATKYRDGRDTNYILTTKTPSYDIESVEAEAGYNMNTLKHLSFVLTCAPDYD